VAFAAALGAALFASPGAASASTSVAQAGDSPKTAAQVVDYWTAKRMRRAQPADLIEVDSSSGGQGGEAPAPQAGPVIPFTPGIQTDTLSFPNRVHGRVFFSDPVSGGNYACSGTAVDAPNRATVITAGHCVDLNGSWNTNFVFVPGYHNGVAPYGVWAASDESALSGWVASGNFRYDVGAAVMALNSSSQTLEDAVGARGILFNQPISGAVRSYGYPAGAPFDGSTLHTCDSTLGYTDPNFPSSPGNPPTLGIGCDMTGGSSGGGWVVTDGSGNGFVNGLNSYKYTTSQPNVMFGPYFGDAAQALYTTMSTEAPGTPGTPSAGPVNVPQAASPAATPQLKCFKKRKKHGKKKRVCRAI
jgi:V8-like Glu-specific endopeptidase